MKPPHDDVTTTGEPHGEVATTVRLRRPWYRTLLSAALIGTVPLAIAGVSSMQYLDPLQPEPTTAVPDNSSRYDGPADDAVEPVAVRRTVDIDPETGGVTVPAKEERVRELSGTGDLDMPAAALKAYRNAAATLANTDPSCNIDWALMAGIGRVESDHGRYGGATVATNGKTYPHILGLPLDGSPGLAAIPDTDNGELDHDTTWDRAVGPMQFIPSTWAMVAADGDGDGVRDPHDLDDAALAAGAYLCAGDADVSTRAGAEAAVFSYNHSDEYVALVLAIADAYRSGEVYLPSVPSGPGTGSAPSLSRAPGNGGAKGAGTKAVKAKPAKQAKKARETGTQTGSKHPSKSAPVAEPSGKRAGGDAPSATPSASTGSKDQQDRKPRQSAEAKPEPPETSEPEPFEPKPVNLAGALTRCSGGLWCLPDLQGGTPTPMDLTGVESAAYDEDETTDLEQELTDMVRLGIGATASGTTQESGVVLVTELIADKPKQTEPAAKEPKRSNQEGTTTNGSEHTVKSRTEQTPNAAETATVDGSG